MIDSPTDGVLVLEDDALYAERLLRQRLGLSEAALAAARKTGLRHVRMSGHRVYLGSWLRHWLDGAATPPVPPGRSGAEGPAGAPELPADWHPAPDWPPKVGRSVEDGNLAPPASRSRPDRGEADR